MATPEQNLRLAELVLCAHDVARFLHRFVSGRKTGLDVRDEAADLVARLTDHHRIAAESGLHPENEVSPTTLTGVVEAAGLHVRGSGVDGRFTDTEAAVTHLLATAPSAGQALLRALPRLTVAGPATPADVEPAARDAWLEQVQEAAEHDAHAVLATLTLPGRTVSAMTVGAVHPERRLYERLVEAHLAELMNASSVTIIGTDQVCPLCFLELATLLESYPLLHAIVHSWGGPVPEPDDDEFTVEPAPVVVVVTDATGVSGPVLTPEADATAPPSVPAQVTIAPPPAEPAPEPGPEPAPPPVAVTPVPVPDVPLSMERLAEEVNLAALFAEPAAAPTTTVAGPMATTAPPVVVPFAPPAPAEPLASVEPPMGVPAPVGVVVDDDDDDDADDDDFELVAWFGEPEPGSAVAVDDDDDDDDFELVAWFGEPEPGSAVAVDDNNGGPLPVAVAVESESAESPVGVVVDDDDDADDDDFELVAWFGEPEPGSAVAVDDDDDDDEDEEDGAGEPPLAAVGAAPVGVVDDDDDDDDADDDDFELMAWLGEPQSESPVAVDGVDDEDDDDEDDDDDDDFELAAWFDEPEPGPADAVDDDEDDIAAGSWPGAPVGPSTVAEPAPTAASAVPFDDDDDYDDDFELAALLAATPPLEAEFDDDRARAARLAEPTVDGGVASPSQPERNVGGSPIIGPEPSDHDAALGMLLAPEQPTQPVPVAEPQLGPASVPPPEKPVSVPEAPTAVPVAETPERMIAMVVQRTHEVVRFLPAFTEPADQADANDLNIEMQRLVARLGERYDILETAGVTTADVSDDDLLMRLPTLHGLDMAGTAEDGSAAQWELDLTRLLVRDTRLSVASRTDEAITVLTGRQLADAMTRLRVGGPAGPDVAPGGVAGRDWQQLLQRRASRPALAMLKLPSGPDLAFMVDSEEGTLVQAYVGGASVPGRGRLPRYLSYPPASDPTTSRHLDAEKKLFDYLATNHHTELEQGQASVAIVCAEPMCPSCCYVALQFLADFPQVSLVTVRLSDGRPAGRLRRLWTRRS